MALISLKVIQYFTLCLYRSKTTLAYRTARSTSLRLRQAPYSFTRCRGHLVVVQSDHRLDAIFVQLVKDIIVELQPCLVGFRVVPVGEDPGPCDGHPVALEAHLGKEFDVLLVVVIEVDGLVAGVVTAGVDAIVDLPLFALGAAHFDVGHAQALAAGVVSAFALVGGRRAAPQKVFVHIYPFASASAARAALSFAVSCLSLSR